MIRPEPYRRPVNAMLRTLRAPSAVQSTKQKKPGIAPGF